MYQNDDKPRVFVSYLTLRRAVGILGMLLPWLLVLGCIVLGAYSGIEDSISDYYGTRVRDVFVGVLFAIALFLFSYRGHDHRDDIAGDLACFCALGVALFPSTSPSALVRAAHFACAASLFLVLSYFSLFLFTKTHEGGHATAEKACRNRVYVACGVIMLMCIGSISLYYAFFRDSAIATLSPVFWLEALALSAFGASWLTKGETLWKDAMTKHASIAPPASPRP